jgi:hypothetical protein
MSSSGICPLKPKKKIARWIDQRFQRKLATDPDKVLASEKFFFGQGLTIHTGLTERPESGQLHMPVPQPGLAHMIRNLF